MATSTACAAHERFQPGTAAQRRKSRSRATPSRQRADPEAQQFARGRRHAPRLLNRAISGLAHGQGQIRCGCQLAAVVLQGLNRFQHVPAIEGNRQFGAAEDAVVGGKPIHDAFRRRCGRSSRPPSSAARRRGSARDRSRSTTTGATAATSGSAKRAKAASAQPGVASKPAAIICTTGALLAARPQAKQSTRSAPVRRLDKLDFAPQFVGIVVRLIQNNDHLASLGLVLQHRHERVFEPLQIAHQGHDDRKSLHRSTFQGAFSGLFRLDGQGKLIQCAWFSGKVKFILPSFYRLCTLFFSAQVSARATSHSHREHHLLQGSPLFGGVNRMGPAG